MGKLTYKLVQRKNPIDKTLKWYPQATRYTTIGKEEVLDLAVQNSNIERSVIETAMLALQEAITTFFVNGHNIQFWPLGSFFSTLKSKGSATENGFMASDIEKLRIRFVPGPLLKKSVSLKQMQFEREEDPEPEEAGA